MQNRQTKWLIFRKVEGVMKIDIENNTILIYAKTPEAAKEARHVSLCQLWKNLKLLTLDFGVRRRILSGPTPLGVAYRRPEGQIYSGQR